MIHFCLQTYIHTNIVRHFTVDLIQSFIGEGGTFGRKLFLYDLRVS